MTTYIMSSSDTPKAELRKTWLDRFRGLRRRAGAFARAARIRISRTAAYSQRHSRTNSSGGWTKCWQFAKECGSNWACCSIRGIGITRARRSHDIVAAGRDRIVHVQINDSAKLPPEKVQDNERLLPGEGVIDLAAFLDALKKIGYDDALSAEVFGRGFEGNAAGGRREARISNTGRSAEGGDRVMPESGGARLITG